MCKNHHTVVASTVRPHTTNPISVAKSTEHSNSNKFPMQAGTAMRAQAHMLLQNVPGLLG